MIFNVAPNDLYLRLLLIHFGQDFVPRRLEIKVGLNLLLVQRSNLPDIILLCGFPLVRRSVVELLQHFDPESVFTQLAYQVTQSRRFAT